MTLAAGATLGPYRIDGQIGRGGMATVYKAYQRALARYVAIKVLPAYLATDDVFRERFRAEAVTVAKLRHPNILSVFDFGEENGVHYLVSEFVDGGTLADQLGRPLPVDYAVRMLAPVASALDYAHARDVVHRDVKPSNVLLARDGTPIVSDFGLARMLMGSMPRLTQTGALVGTPEYMAPEQAAGEEAGPAADRYALAIIAYEMVVGTVPYSADTPLATLLAHLHRPLPLPHERNPQLAPAVEEVLLKGLAKDPKDRYGTASELIRALSMPAAVSAPPPVAETPRPATVTAPAPAPTPAPAAVTASPPAPMTTATAPAASRGRSRREMVLGAGAIGILALIVGSQFAPSLVNEEDSGPSRPVSIYVEASADQVEVTTDHAAPKLLDLKVTYRNDRAAPLRDIVVTLPLKDGTVAVGHGEQTPEGWRFLVGDLGPWAVGDIGIAVFFTQRGSRIIEPTLRATDVASVTADAITIRVTDPVR